MVSHSEANLQIMVDAFHSIAQSLGFTINTRKTDVMLQSPRKPAYAAPELSLDRNQPQLWTVSHTWAAQTAVTTACISAATKV